MTVRELIAILEDLEDSYDLEVRADGCQMCWHPVTGVEKIAATRIDNDDPAGDFVNIQTDATR